MFKARQAPSISYCVPIRTSQHTFLHFHPCSTQHLSTISIRGTMSFFVFCTSWSSRRRCRGPWSAWNQRYSPILRLRTRILGFLAVSIPLSLSPIGSY
ncbi:hypothetical protein K491DRAFT_328996 [Lophiostoma macrostomum CBS 122681]|uniref:Uncharacterized protein n=1 Tax=Lophiostoma macrostomum CBS 122681 TaxID=1314788 RepID=A0A6A6TBF4_9PLEO|nr:hypothetical protein K491DRAFT_328996 [Lophiostoma macrostomum CBS 122681]